MSYLITGGTGLIGAYITRLLVKQGEQVVTYDTNPSRNLLERLMNEDELKQVKVITGDVTDLPHLIRTAQEYKIEKIIHMAFILSTAAAVNPPLAIKVNVEGTVNVYETARILGIKKVVWASSLSVFGEREKYKEEYTPNDAPHFPEGIYGACKNHNELVAAFYCKTYGMDITGIRFGMVYGKGQASGASGKLTEELLRKPFAGEQGQVPWGDDTINFVYVEDAARAAVMASNAATTKTRVFNMNGDYRSIADVIAYVKTLIPGADITSLPGYTAFPSKYETSRIKEELGYEPQWTIERGFKAIIDDIRDGSK
ncbi:NAD-dependent epimerase/dehydratase family protein [Chloroflexota bacterium]